MRFDVDWTYVRRYTTMPMLSAVCAVLALVAALWVHGKQVEKHRQFSANHSVIQEDYDALVHRRRIVDRYHRRYRQFSELGFVGVESRLEWIETLRASTQDLTLPRVSYVIQPQLNVTAPVDRVIGANDVRIHMSKLELEMSLVHELDLLHFVDELQRNAPGLMKVDRCDLDWQSEPGAELEATANIMANCNIDIYSVITSDVAPEGES